MHDKGKHLIELMKVAGRVVGAIVPYFIIKFTNNLLLFNMWFLTFKNEGKGGFQESGQELTVERKRYGEILDEFKIVIGLFVLILAISGLVYT